MLQVGNVLQGAIPTTLKFTRHEPILRIDFVVLSPSPLHLVLRLSKREFKSLPLIVVFLVARVFSGVAS